MYAYKHKSDSKDKTSQRKVTPYEGRAKRTGIPVQMLKNAEKQSRLSFDDVKVHYNSPKPAQLQAHAYTNGSDVHIAPGQERHLGHELGHVVQQKQGRVQPTMQLQGVSVNDDVSLEDEADLFGDVVQGKWSYNCDVIQMACNYCTNTNCDGSCIICANCNESVLDACECEEVTVDDDADYDPLRYAYSADSLESYTGFDEVSKDEIEISMTGTRASDKQLNELAPEPGYEWHHWQDFNSSDFSCTMSKVEAWFHQQHPHSGACSEYGRFMRLNERPKFKYK
jgi:hypothetical protein